MYIYIYELCIRLYSTHISVYVYTVYIYIYVSLCIIYICIYTPVMGHILLLYLNVLYCFVLQNIELLEAELGVAARKAGTCSPASPHPRWDPAPRPGHGAKGSPQACLKKKKKTWRTRAMEGGEISFKKWETSKNWRFGWKKSLDNFKIEKYDVWDWIWYLISVGWNALWTNFTWPLATENKNA